MAINKATALAEIDSVFAHRSSLGPTLTDVLLVEMITLWCIRNDAAHANYNKYVDTQVKLMVDGIRDFITRHPA